MAKKTTRPSSKRSTDTREQASQRQAIEAARREGLVKIAIADRDGDFETPWAMPVGRDRYRLENTPFFAYGLSWQDIVEARVDRSRHPSLPVFKRVIEKGGHRTIRVAGDGVDVPKALVDALVKLGATFEGLNPAYLCFDLGPKVDPQRVVDELERWEDEPVSWEHADPE